MLSERCLSGLVSVVVPIVGRNAYRFQAYVWMVLAGRFIWFFSMANFFGR